jgi:CheY-like chemotaxis protein
MDSSATPEHGAAAGPRGRVLLVEDDLEAAEFIRYVLTRRGGYEVTHTPDPRAALVLAAAEPWNLVLTDLDLPAMSGAELIGSLRRLAPSLPVILITARSLGARPLDIWPADSAACRPDALLAKPVPAEQLLEAVERIRSR